jgi:hypothetical protein
MNTYTKYLYLNYIIYATNSRLSYFRMMQKQVYCSLLNSFTIANLVRFVFSGMNTTFYFGIVGVFSCVFLYLLFKHASYKVFYEMYADEFHRKNEISTPMIKFLVDYAPGISILLFFTIFFPIVAPILFKVH